MPENARTRMLIGTSRITLRDLQVGDRDQFVAYQMDPRYLRLYDLERDPARAEALFDLFIRWQTEEPRRNFQIGIFDAGSGNLCGVAGLRKSEDDSGGAVLGLELAPHEWGRYRIAFDTVACLIEHGFTALRLRRISGDTASGNKRIEKLALWFGAHIQQRRDGPEWMRARGWEEVEWVLDRDEWCFSAQRDMLIRRLLVPDLSRQRAGCLSVGEVLTLT
jgi:ribosomal-protein-alanine N-acetyltransferase